MLVEERSRQFVVDRIVVREACVGYFGVDGHLDVQRGEMEIKRVRDNY